MPKLGYAECEDMLGTGDRLKERKEEIVTLPGRLCDLCWLWEGLSSTSLWFGALMAKGPLEKSSL